MSRRPPDEFEDAARRLLESELPDVDVDAFSLTFDLFRAYTQVQKRIETEVYRPAGVTAAGFRIMFTLLVAGGSEPRQLARLSGVTTAATTGVVNKLEGSGLVERRPHPTDGRRQFVELTADGRRVTSETYRRQHDLERRLVSEMPSDDVEAATGVLRRIIEFR